MPLIAKASAIVTDYAGMIYDQWIAVTSSQIPIVVETKAATRIIQTGQIVTVNGDQGTVRLG
jgi:pyruvate,water dikinase